jgi:adenylate kinase
MSGSSERNLVVLGPPGAGKGTQAARLSQRLEVPHIATGDILREAVAQGTELGRQAQDYMDRGDLVPDELVIAIVRERLARTDCAGGFVLDGFPRTVPQAQALDEVMCELGRGPLKVLNLEVGEGEILRRLSGRRTCRGCEGIFNVDQEGIEDGNPCPACGGELYQRTDDRPEAVRERLAVYHRQTEALIQYYSDRGLLTNLSGEGVLGEIEQRTWRAAHD